MVGIGQQEVYDFLTHHKGKWFTSRDISEQLNVSIGSVTMSLKKLRKTNLIKYKNTGVRNTFIYTVEPEGITVPPPPGIIEAEEHKEERKPAKQERIMPKIVVAKRSVPIVVRREPEKKPEAPKAITKKTKPKPKKPMKKGKPKAKPAKKTVKKAPKKTKPKKMKKIVKRTAKKTTRKTVKKAVKKTKPKKATKKPVAPKKTKPKKSFLGRLLRR